MNLHRLLPVICLCLSSPSLSFGAEDSEASLKASKKGPMKFVETTEPRKGPLKLKPAWVWGSIGFVDTNSPETPKTDLGVEENFQNYRFKFVNSPDPIEFLVKKYDLHPLEEKVVRKIYKLQRAVNSEAGLSPQQVKAEIKAIGISEFGLSFRQSAELSEILLSPRAASLEIPEILNTYLQNLEKILLTEQSDGKRLVFRADYSEAARLAREPRGQKRPIGFLENKVSTDAPTDLTTEENFRKFQYKFVVPNDFDRMDYLRKIYALNFQQEQFFRQVRELRHSKAPVAEVMAELRALGEKVLELSKEESRAFAKAVLDPANKAFDTIQVVNKFGEALVQIRSKELLAEDVKITRDDVEARAKKTPMRMCRSAAQAFN